VSRYYRPRRSRNLYTPGSEKPFKISRSKIDLFVECPRCFYIDRRLGTGRPPGFPFSLNNAVDSLLKTEFDRHRVAETMHPLIESYGLDARPVGHHQLDDWRENFKGVQYLHEATNLLITGAIDDLWIDSQGNYIVVDYKATAKSDPVTALDQPWQDSYKRQMEVYQWLVRRNDLTVSDTGYFVYCTGRKNAEVFDARLDFDIHLIPYRGKDEWVEPKLHEIHTCLNAGQVPEPGSECDYCAYVSAVGEVTADGVVTNS
jgi:CRISPR/Cas system-associated exonuclease Cas4 (RecB family)